MPGWARNPSEHRVVAVVSAFALSAVFFVAIGAAIPLRDHTPVIVVWGLVCAVVVAGAATRLGALYGVPFAIAAAAAFDSYYIPPTRPFGAGDRQNILVIALYLGGGVLVGALADRSRRRAETSEAERARLADEQAALRRVATLVARGVDPSEVFAAAAVEMRDLLGTDMALIMRFESDATGTIVAESGGAGRTGERWKLEPPLAAAEVRATGRTTRVDDYHVPPPWIQHTFDRLGGIRASVASPVVVGGRLWGAMVVSSRRRTLPAGTEQRMIEFTELLAIAIANADSHEQLTASRARIVAASDAARRRLERDLHDGVQQRLVSLALGLRRAEKRTPPEVPEVRAVLSETVEGLNHATDELREIARGIHPAILTQGGLGTALRTLARRSAVPTEVSVDAEQRLPERVEVAAYYVVAEALTNTAKHASASRASVDVRCGDGTLHIRVRDDGVGGADAGRGSGLIGLCDRVEALGGTISVESPPGDGTSLDVSFPLG